MAEVASRELRNDTAGLIRRAASGEEIVITVRGEPAARLVPMASRRRRWLRREELGRRLQTSSADPGLSKDLQWISDQTTDDLGPIG